MSNDEYAGSSRDIGRCESTFSRTDGASRSGDFDGGSSGVSTESKTSGDKVYRLVAIKFYLFIQNGWLKILPIIKEPFYLIGETIVDIFEHPFFRAVLYMAVIFCLIALFIEIGYGAALHEYGITPGNTPIGG